MNSELWDRWFELEHNHRRRLAFAATLPEDYAEPEAEEDFDWSSEDGGADPPVKMEDQEDEDEQLKKVIEASELEELRHWPELAAALRASAENAANRMEEPRHEEEGARWQVHWSPSPEHGEGQAYVLPPVCQQAPVAPATPPPVVPPAWLYAAPPYIILDPSDEDE